MSFDIVVPVGPNDISQIETQLNYTKTNVIGYRNIYLVSFDPSLNIPGCITVDEKVFPFTKNDVGGKETRRGWYLQQLLKLYSGFVVPDILDTYLVIDSDTHFMKPTTFIDQDGICLYNPGTENHKPYFDHMQKLHPSLSKMTNMSGISHHMIFQTKYIKELFEWIELKHNNQEFWKIFLNQIEYSNNSGASEYELYFHFMLKYHPNEIKIRQLKWKNYHQIDDSDCDYISVHSYLRR